MKELPDYIQFKQFPGTPLNDIFTAAGDDLLDVLGKMLSVNPLNRCTATQVSFTVINVVYFLTIGFNYEINRFHSVAFDCSVST